MPFSEHRVRRLALAGVATAMLGACGGGRFGAASSQRALLLPAGEHEVTSAARVTTTSNRVGGLARGASLGYRYGFADGWNLALPLPAVSRRFEFTPDLSFAAELGVYWGSLGLTTVSAADPRYRGQERFTWSLTPGASFRSRLGLGPTDALVGQIFFFVPFDSSRNVGLSSALRATHLHDLTSWLTLGLSLGVFHDQDTRVGVELGTPHLALHLTDGLDLIGGLDWSWRSALDERRFGATLMIDWYWD